MTLTFGEAKILAESEGSGLQPLVDRPLKDDLLVKTRVPQAGVTEFVCCQTGESIARSTFCV